MSVPQPYPGYVDRRVEWLGKVPSHWAVGQLKRFARIVNGGTPTPESANWDGDIAWATPVDLNAFDGQQVLQTIRTLTSLGLANGSAAVPPGSVVVSTRAPIGYSAIATQELAFNQGCKGLVPGRAMSPSYLLYAMQAARQELGLRGQGTTFLELSTASLGSIPIPAPPRSEQAAVVDFLDRETAEIDAFIADQEGLIKLLAERRSAAEESAMSRAEGFPRVRLRFLFKQSREDDSAGSEVLSVYRDYGVIVKSSRADNFNKTPDDVSRYLVVRPGYLVVNKMKAWQGSLGVSQHEGIVSPDYEVLRPVSDALSSEYVHAYMRSPRMVGEYAVRSVGIRPSQWRLYWDELRDISIPVPDLGTQRGIVDDVRGATDEIDGAIADAREAIALSRERRAALISAAVTGKIDVRGAARSNVPHS